MKLSISILGLITLLLVGFVSCTKESVALDSPSGQSLLLAHTWKVKEVTELVSGKAIMVYSDSRSYNAEDYSLVRQSFKPDGTMHYIDQFGNTGTDGEFELLRNESKIKLAIGLQRIVGEQVAISTNHLEYTIKLSDEDAIKYKLTPVL